MIEMPRRSVTRFFIPLIDVLTLLFCIYLLMPIVKPADGDEQAAGPAIDAKDPKLSDLERKELEQLRREKKSFTELDRLRRELEKVKEQLARLQKEKISSLQHHLAVRVLQIGDEGKLYYFDAGRDKDRSMEITADNVQNWIGQRQKESADKELYVLILYPRVASGIPVYPLQSQREQYDRWFQSVAHGYDVPK